MSVTVSSEIIEQAQHLLNEGKVSDAWNLIGEKGKGTLPLLSHLAEMKKPESIQVVTM